MSIITKTATFAVILSLGLIVTVAICGSGKGIIGIHAATDNFYQWEEGAKMMGGLFCQHPWTSGCTVQVKLDEPDHPLNACFHGESFKVKDEIYQFKDPYSRKNQRIITSRCMSLVSGPDGADSFTRYR